MRKASLRNGARILLRRDGALVQLPSGRIVRSRPRGEGDQEVAAQLMGYGSDVASMCREHDALHALLTDWLGLSTSFSLSEAAGQPIDPELAGYEEAAVIAVQTFMRRSGGSLPLDAQASGGFHD